MIAPDTQERQLELWPALGALLLAGLLSTLVPALLLDQLWIALAAAQYGRTLFLLETLVATAVTAFALPLALRAVAGFDITRGRAFVVALGGGLVSLAFDLLLTAAFTATTGVIDGGSVSIGPMIVSFAVEYRNREGSAPAYVRVVIDGHGHAMHATGALDYKSGVHFAFRTTLGAGTHRID